jgi:DNA-binding Lrp family transcriptional regulator
LWIRDHAEGGKLRMSYGEMAKQFGWSRSKVQRFLAKVEAADLATRRTIQVDGSERLEISVKNEIVQVIPDTPSDTPQVEMFDQPDRVNEAYCRYEKPTPLPDDFKLPRSWGEWAMEECGMTRDEVRAQASRFRAYWIDAAETKKGRKKVWALAWRNWIRSPYRKPIEQVTAETDGLMDEMRAKYGG